MKEALPADSIVMEFNPWLSLSDRSLVTAYFNSLANVVSENLDKDLFSPIQKYGEAIASLEGIGGWMEVLRLIRNTADFPGIVYIVAYDKGYVAAQLTIMHAISPSLSNPIYSVRSRLKSG